MEDRELLERAARAVGFVVFGDVDKHIVQPGHFAGGLVIENMKGGHGLWNSLTDDGDALRLAVKLKLQLTLGTYNQDLYSAYSPNIAKDFFEHYSYMQDEAAATRRAITLAAAAIGKEMK